MTNNLKKKRTDWYKNNFYLYFRLFFLYWDKLQNKTKTKV